MSKVLEYAGKERDQGCPTSGEAIGLDNAIVGLKKPEKTDYSQEDLRILIKLAEYEYGWGKFAQIILGQGWISPKQRQTIISMERKLDSQRSNTSYSDLAGYPVQDYGYSGVNEFGYVGEDYL